MATTRIISMHVSHGKTIADCLTDRIDYSKNPDKTQGGELISAYECDPKTADAEFLYSKRQYQTVTGREQRHDVIAYQVRQSFKPGEITPEEANRVGYEFAERFLKGRHAFFVATHTDKKHIHNHIIWNSTTLDCKHKFRDFLGSGRVVGQGGGKAQRRHLHRAPAFRNRRSEAREKSLRQVAGKQGEALPPGAALRPHRRGAFAEARQL